MVTNCSGENYLSKFKIIENELKCRNIPGEGAHTKHTVHYKWQT